MTENLTDEQLHAMAESFNNPRVRAAATELIEFRAERTKPTQSAPSREAVEAALEAFYGKPSKTWFDWERDEMSRALTAALPHLFSSIRAEGSAERARLEAALKASLEAESKRVDEYDNLFTTWTESRKRHLAAEASVAKLEAALRSVRKNIPEGCSTAFMIINEPIAQPAESGATLNVLEYESLHNDPQKLWAWILLEGDKIIDTQDGFASEYEAISHGRCVQRNYAGAKA
jgi:hypothetical protein